MKIAINKCYGGFSLSKEAYEFMGIPWDGYGYKFSDHDERTNVKLIECIEALGDKASGRYSKVVVVKIPDDVNWGIEEYDGVEWVSEAHRIWG